MDLLSPLRTGVGLGRTLAGGALRFATSGPRLVTTLLRGGPRAAADEARGTAVDAAVNASPGAERSREEALAAARELARRPPAEARADASSANGDVPAARPEPTSAAGASAGVGGTLDAPGDAARVAAPDPTAADTEEPRSGLPKGERRTIDVSTPDREADPDADEAAVVYSFGDPDEVGPAMEIDEPWEGYATMRAVDIIARLSDADDATKGVVLLYEQAHKNRKGVLSAASEG